MKESRKVCRSVRISKAPLFYQDEIFSRETSLQYSHCSVIIANDRDSPTLNKQNIINFHIIWLDLLLSL